MARGETPNRSTAKGAGPARRSAQRREDILRAATVLLNRDGVKGMTLASVAVSLGVQTPNITYYFRKKEDLAAACLMRGIERLHGMIIEAARQPTAEARLAAFVRLYFTLLRGVATGEQPPLALLDDTLALDGQTALTVQGALALAFRDFRNLLKAPDVAGLSWRDRSARAHLIFNVVTWAPAWIGWHDPDDYPRAAERLIDIMLGGLAAPGRTSPLHAPILSPRAESGPSREAFLIAATRLINQRGYRGARVDEIAAQLKVTRGSFYHHIDAKEDLVIACFERSFAVIRHTQRAAAAGDADSLTRLTETCAALVAFQLSDQGPLLRSTALSALPADDHMAMVLESRRVSTRFASLVSDGVREGVIRPVDAEIASQAVTAALNAAPDLLQSLPDATAAEAVEIYLRPLLFGMLCGPTA